MSSPQSDVDGNTGYVKNMDTIATHGGYITKGDNNPTSDQGSLYYANTGKIEPVQKDWVVGKALFAIPVRRPPPAEYRAGHRHRASSSWCSMNSTSAGRRSRQRKDRRRKDEEAAVRR